MRRIPLLLLNATIALLLPSAAFADEGDCNVTKARSVALTVPRAPLDFNGDSVSEYVGFIQDREKDTTEFWVYSQSTLSTSTASLPKGVPAPSDYDGDGKSDFATVSSARGKRVWNISLSSTGETIAQSFGESDDTFLFGCRLLGNSKSSLVTVRGRSILALEVGATTPVKIGTLPESVDQILGCGDISGEGTDAILFTARSKNSSVRLVATLGCANQVLPFRSIKDFRSAGIVQVDRDDFPLLITLRDLDAKRDIVTLQSVSELFPYPKFFFDKRAAFSSGRYKSIDGTLLGYGVAYVADKETNQVVQRLLEAQIPRPEPVVIMPKGYQIVQPQGVIR
jgi:hypothetical protein